VILSSTKYDDALRGRLGFEVHSVVGRLQIICILERVSCLCGHSVDLLRMQSSLFRAEAMPFEPCL
jgi:hypothetical protein